MKNLKKICCIIAAAAMLVFCLPLHAYADAMPAQDAWYIGKKYQVNSTGVYGYTHEYVLGDGAKEEECAFRKGDAVYVKYAVERKGITWGMCVSTSNQYDADWEFYGWTDMRYLSPIGTVYEETPVKTEIVTELVTVLPDTPPATKPATTSAKIKTSVVTMKVTSSETTKKTAQAVLSEEEDSGSDSGSFFEDNFSVLTIICVLILVVSSITLAAGLINYNKKRKLNYSDMQYMPDQTPDQTPRERPSVRNQMEIKYCAKCGAKNPVQAVFCSKCGAPFYSVNGKNQ